MSRNSRIKASQSAASIEQPRRRTLAAIGSLLALATVLCYGNTFSVPFQFDDRSRIEENTAIRQLRPVSAPMADSNRPFGMATFAVNYAVHGYQVWGYHATNLMIHILAGLMLFGIVRRTLVRYRADRQQPLPATALAFAVALLWLVHPLNTQAVTYIVQRLESLMGLCYLATLYCFIRAQDSPQRNLWYAASIACCALGMGVKEVMVTAPLMVVWYDRVFVSKSWRDLFRDHGRYYLGMFATWGVLVWAMLRTQVEYSSGNFALVKGITPLSYLLSQAGVITHYLRLSFWPVGQCLDYGWPIAQTAGEIIPPLLFIGVLVVATIWTIFRHPAWGLLGGWFFVILGPTSSVVPIIDLAFEQRMYLPLAAVVTLTVVGGYAMLKRTVGRIAVVSSQRLISNPARAIMLGTVLVSTITVALGVLTYRRNGWYSSELSIWNDVVAKRPNNPRGHVNLAVALVKQGKYGLAGEHCQEAIRLKPDVAEAYQNLGAALNGQGMYDQAVEACRKAIRLMPERPDVYNTLGCIFNIQGDFDRAVEQYYEAIRIEPDYVEAHNNLGNALQNQGKLDLAVEQYHIAIGLNSGYADAYNNLGNTLHKQGKLDQAIEQYQTAIRLKPHYAEAHYNLGRARQEQGNSELAMDEIRTALRLKPGYAEAHNKLGAILHDQGNLDSAIEQYREAIRFSPEDADTYINLGNVLQRQGKLDLALEQYDYAIRLKPRRARGYYNRSVAHYKSQKYDQAWADLRTCRELGMSPKPEYVEALKAASGRAE